jgi:hypothetical protein
MATKGTDFLNLCGGLRHGAITVDKNAIERASTRCRNMSKPCSPVMSADSAMASGPVRLGHVEGFGEAGGFHRPRGMDDTILRRLAGSESAIR